VDSAGKSFTVKDYAWNSTANQGLYAGEGIPSSLNKNSLLNNLSILVHDRSVIIDILSTDFKVYGFQLYDFSGKLIQNKDCRGTKDRQIINNLNPGLYILQIITNKGTACKKVMIN
jgi:hypothetical protein